IIALTSISKNPSIGGKGFAITGIILGAFVFVISIIFFSLIMVAMFGVLNTVKLLPDQCIFNEGINCMAYNATAGEDGKVMVTLVNTLDHDMVLTEVFAKGILCTDEAISPAGTGTWVVGEVKNFEFDCSGGKAGDKARELVLVKYKKVGGKFDNAISGQVSVTIS
ncbi:hypothetical protein ACFL6I_13740, partial [candidate division KSB1 bacterium]